MNFLKKNSIAWIITIITVLSSSAYLYMIYPENQSSYNQNSAENGQNEQYGIGFSQILEEDGVTQGEIASVVRDLMQNLAENYEGEVTIISTPSIVNAPNLDEFIPAPTTIYTTLGSENGFGGTFMFARGQIEEWATNSGQTTFTISNEDGKLFFGIGEPLMERALSEYRELLPVGTNVRVYFEYLGFSGVLDLGGGTAIGFSIIE